MRKVTTEYVCDSCGAEVESAKDLQKFALERVARGRKFGPRAISDLCDDCEARLLAAVEPLFPGEEIPDLQAMRREEA